MTDFISVFLFGPLYFFPLLLSLSIESPHQMQIFVTSGLGTTFWVAVISAIWGVIN